MIEWAYRRARQSASFDRLLVATDSQEIAAHCRGLAIPVMITSPSHRSGTERIIEVMGRELADVYVNIQGDEPMVSAEHIDLLLRPFSERADTQVSTLKVAITPEEAQNPNNVKVVTGFDHRALYFSRSPIPYDRDRSGGVRYFKHLGLYAYSAAALARFSALAPSPLEISESLEQLRYLENGIPIAVLETGQDTIGVDTEEDLRKVEEYFRRAGIDAPPAG